MACRDNQGRKSSWPELVGARGVDVEATIERENPNVSVEIVLEGTGVPEEFSCIRVRVWVNKDGIIVEIPTIG